MFFSVVIPTYNRASLLPRAIESVLNQNYPDFELWIIDDGSSDNTHQLEERWITPSVHWLKTEHKGVSAARNLGANKASGKWLSFLDSDDIWHKEKLSRQEDFIKNNPDFKIFQTNEIWIRKGKRVNPPIKYQKKSQDLFEQSLQFCAITPSAVCLQKDLFHSYGGFDEALPCCEDYDLWLRLSAKHSVGLLDELLVTRYEGHPDQLSHNYIAMDRFRIYSLLKLIWFGDLKPEQILKTKKILEQKINIFLNGMEKRKLKTKNLKNFLEEIYKESLDLKNQKEIFAEITSLLLHYSN